MKKPQGTRPPNRDDGVKSDAQEAYMQILEPLVVGLLSGQKKLVIDSKPSIASVDQHGIPLVSYRHTFKVVDSDT